MEAFSLRIRSSPPPRFFPATVPTPVWLPRHLPSAFFFIASPFFVVTAAAVGAPFLFTTDIRKSGAVFRRNARQIKHWLEEDTASAATRNDGEIGHMVGDALLILSDSWSA